MAKTPEVHRQVQERRRLYLGPSETSTCTTRYVQSLAGNGPGDHMRSPA